MDSRNHKLYLKKVSEKYLIHFPSESELTFVVSKTSKAYRDYKVTKWASGFVGGMEMKMTFFTLFR